MNKRKVSRTWLKTGWCRCLNMSPRRAKTEWGLSVTWAIYIGSGQHSRSLISILFAALQSIYRLLPTARYLPSSLNILTAYLFSLTIAARYNAWHLPHFFKCAAALLAAAMAATDSYRLIFLAEYSNGDLLRINIAARYNAWHLTHFSKCAATLLDAPMVAFPHLRLKASIKH